VFHNYIKLYPPLNPLGHPLSLLSPLGSPIP